MTLHTINGSVWGVVMDIREYCDEIFVVFMCFDGIWMLYILNMLSIIGIHTMIICFICCLCVWLVVASLYLYAGVYFIPTQLISHQKPFDCYLRSISLAALLYLFFWFCCLSMSVVTY